MSQLLMKPNPRSAEIMEKQNELPESLKQEMNYYATGDKVKYLLTKHGKKWLTELQESYSDKYDAYVEEVLRKSGVDVSVKNGSRKGEGR